MMAGGKPVKQACLIFGQLDPGNTGLLEAQFRSPLPDLRYERRIVNVGCGCFDYGHWIYGCASEYVADITGDCTRKDSCLMNEPLPVAQSAPLYSASQLRELDRLAIEQAGIPGYTLMTRAAQAAWSAIQARWPELRSLVLLCGTGNNGGDGYVLARLAQSDGCQARVLQLGDAERIRGDALTARNDWLEAGGVVVEFDAASLQPADVIVDALLGTGFERALDAQWADAIRAVNDSAVPVVALDIPSGLRSDSGAVADSAIRAQLTVTFIGRKAGLYTGAGPDRAGEIVLADLAVPAAVMRQVRPQAELQVAAELHGLAVPRSRSAHKGSFGHVLVIGGDHGMAGAVRLAGEAALRTGAGLVTVATRAEHTAAIMAGCPELICHGIENARQLRAVQAKATVIVIGPGLGQSDWAAELLGTVLETRQPLVVDADALNLIAREPVRQQRWIMTPHPGEAARLLQQDTATVQSDRFAAAAAINRQYGGVTVLKGAGTIVHAEDRLPMVCAAGNPGMATAGMGDVLSGILGGLLAQGLTPAQAARAGVCVHACAGDHAARDGERGLLARDVIAGLRGVMNAAP
jgi:NAD(P)H-hydrate epimerase